MLLKLTDFFWMMVGAWL